MRVRTVGAMDGAIEPPWMGLQRVLPRMAPRLRTVSRGGGASREALRPTEANGNLQEDPNCSRVRGP